MKTRNLYISKEYDLISARVIQSAKILSAKLNCKSYHTIIWLAAHIGLKEIGNIEKFKEFEKSVLTKLREKEDEN